MTQPSPPFGVIQAVYANSARIANTPWDMTLDFLLLTPSGEISAEEGAGTPLLTVPVARVVMSPMHGKALAKAMAEAVKAWEDSNGKLPEASSGGAR